MVECCGSCRYWDDHGDADGPLPRQGDCRRYPPQRNLTPDDDETLDYLLVDFPVTVAHWWCGEFRQRGAKG